MSTMIRRICTAVVATALLLAGTVTTATADPQGHDVQPHREAFFYGDFDEEVALFAGATTQDFCYGQEPSSPARVFTREDGSVEVKMDAVVYPIHLYATSLGGPELIEATCQAMFDGDPDTQPLEPFAHGDGLVRLRLTIASDGSVHIVNSTVGSATAADGTTWKVRGWADLVVVDGVPVGSPTEFQGLRIAVTGG